MDEYEKLLAEAQRSPATSDFLALRQAYTRSPLFNPYLNAANIPMALRRAVQQDDQNLIGAGLQRVLQEDYLDIEAHIVAHNFYRQSGKIAKAEYHAAFARGLLASIMRVNGRSFEKAFEVISIREEYAVMNALGLRVTMQRKATHIGKNYDILTAQHPQTGEELDFYFNIDRMRSFWGSKTPKKDVPTPDQ